MPLKFSIMSRLLKIYKISLVLLFFVFIAGCATDSTESIKPNIVFIFADDMGYGDVSALNPKSRIKTPAIDALVNGGISFSDAHASASVCTPSRYGLLTGRYAFRSERAASGISGFTKSVIESERETVASVLKHAGYTTACIGKWHLGVNWKTKDGSAVANLDRQTGYSNVDYTQKVTGGPNDFGFDYSFIHPASLDIPPYVFLRNQQVVDPDMILATDVYSARQENTVFSWDKKHSDDLAVYWEKGVWWRQGEMSRSFKIEDCLSEILNEGLLFIENQAIEKPGNPFFLYLPLTGPHTPWMPTEPFKGKTGIGKYGDFVLNIDDVVKQIKAALVEKGIDDNTLLIFSSDNGAYWPEVEIELHNHDSNEGRRGQKGDVWDGGHRTPLIISWPAKIKQPGVYDQLVSLTDFFATILDITGQKKNENHGEDSYSFWHVLNGDFDKPVREKMVHHSSGNMYCIRSEGWKYIDGLGSGGFTAPSTYAPEPNGPTGQLYNLKDDPKEATNLFLQMPEKITELKQELEKSLF